MAFIFVLFCCCFLFAEKQLGDGVLAVVGPKVVLFSTVLDETNLTAQEQGLSVQKNPFLYEKVFKQVLEKNINNKIILSFAEKDSSLFVDYSEIKEVLDDRISFYVSRFGSVSEFEKQVGFSVAEMKEKNWRVVEEELLIEKFRIKNFKNVSVTKHDVFAFYEEYKDSLPPSPAFGTFSVLEKEVSFLKKNKDFYLASLKALRDSLSFGFLNFSEVASKRSQDPSVKNNEGILTSFRGDLVPEYEKTAYSLNENEVGEVVKTRFGYHIIKLLEKKGEKIKTQHILLKPKKTQEDFLFASSFLDSLKQKSINDPGVFDSLCVVSGFGLSGHYEKEALVNFPEKIISFIKEGGAFSFSKTIKNEDSFFLIYKYAFSPEEKKTLKNSWFELEDLALNKKRFDVFNLWIKNKKKEIYVQINEIR